MADDVKDLREDDAEGQAPSASEAEASEADEIKIFRSELAKTQEALEAAQAEAEDFKNKHLRALAEMQTIRRRTASDVERAKNQGADSVVLSVIPVYDDLRRALEVAGDDPAKIVPGIEQVRETLKRNLENLGIQEMGKVGDDFNPEFHEALTTMPTEDDELKGKIAQVFESGFVKDDRVIRVARVVVYAD
ncbi:MAG: nucleotide exchange factor GrpE [Trueperaceae bacterium]|nr:nucleotide exchange factor GrpE [Trueperaceae bacterium]